MTIKIGLIGKTNTGKTTFFNSATLKAAEVSNYPFTTKSPNIGIAQTATICVHKELNVKDNPINSQCIDGWRAIPVEIIDLPGLIKGAWTGKGLGNQFLSVAAQSDALLHIVDASGGIDAEGRITEPGAGDPVADLGDIEEEMVMWYVKLIEGNRDRIIRGLHADHTITTGMMEVLAGIGVNPSHIQMALDETKLNEEDFPNWNADSLKQFAWILRDISKPTLIVANKMDLEGSAENFKRIREQYNDMIVVPASAEAELTLRLAEQKHLIRYLPGQERFDVLDQTNLSEKQRWALSYIRQAVLGEYMRTGVQFAINVAVFKLLKMNTVYPVQNPEKLSDKRGNILPDVYLLPAGSTVTDLAKEVHSDLARGLLYAIDARTGLQLPTNYQIKDRDVLSIVSAARKKTQT
ncbi:MAG: redox-regulated ATPase YchF [Thaumarchaeota archaeon]|nr:redox-regulated ATPase YchF [Nitrososphaerota archaeon]MCL5318738.1 redox-regulated ATPase YchF [Nitrososphaerota archaeon]